MKKKYKIIGLPMHFGADSLGLTFGIDELKKEMKKKNIDCIKKIDIINQEENFEYKDFKYINSIKKNCENLAIEVNSILKDGCVPITIGGDHSIAMGSISASSSDDFGVLWIDAHGDSNTPETTITGNVHGMPLAAMQGYGHEKLVNIFKEGQKVKSENVVIFGARDLDYREKQLLEKLKVLIIYNSDIRAKGFEREFNRAMEYLKEKTNNIHLSFDLDVINPKIMPGVSIPVEDGLTKEEANIIFDFIKDNDLIRSIDIVEYNPIFDIKHETRDFVINILKKFI